VSRVVPAGPAARAGVRTGDLLTAVNTWAVEAMRREAALSVVQAAGYHMLLGLAAEEEEEEEGWEEVDSV
jgi:S1-C subfamily serine protease